MKNCPRSSPGTAKTNQGLAAVTDCVRSTRREHAWGRSRRNVRCSYQQHTSFFEEVFYYDELISTVRNSLDHGRKLTNREGMSKVFYHGLTNL